MFSKQLNQSKQYLKYTNPLLKSPPPISSRVAANSGSTGCSDSLINAMEIYVLGLISMDVYICLPKPRGVQSKPFLGIDLLCS